MKYDEILDGMADLESTGKMKIQGAEISKEDLKDGYIVNGDEFEFIQKLYDDNGKDKDAAKAKVKEIFDKFTGVTGIKYEWRKLSKSDKQFFESIFGKSKDKKASFFNF